MNKIVNRVRNHHFDLGRDTPRHWEVRLDPCACEAHRRPATKDRSAGLVLVPRSPAPAFMWQVQTCKPDAWYRIEAVVRCELVPTGPAGGFALVAVVEDAGESEGFEHITPPLHDAPATITVRTYFHAPHDCKRFRLGVGVRDAVGLVEIDDVRMIRILEPDEISHPHALQAPFAPGLPPVESVSICSAESADRPLAEMLRLAMGKDRVACVRPDDAEQVQRFEAVLFPDARPPAFLRTLKDLLRLCEAKLVVVSLPAFVALTREAVRIRRIEQPDDPIHAKVAYACPATRGFALHDSFAFAWPGKSPSSFVQNQFREDDAFRAFCKKHHFKTLLVSNCDKNATSDRPICLHHNASGGGLFVLDLNPIEAPASTMGEPTLAAHLLLSILRRSPAPAGQYVAPVRREVELRDMIREAPNRWDHFSVYDDDVPSAEVTHQIVTVGREDEMFGLPVAPKPVILIRSGLVGGDTESFYGVWSWIRQLLLHARHSGSYAAALTSKFRLAWVPLSASWETRDGWSASRLPSPIPTEIEFDEGSVAALIDLVPGIEGGVRVKFAHPTPAYRRASYWMPRIASAFSAHEFPALIAGCGGAPGSRRPLSWRSAAHRPEVSCNSDWMDDIHRTVASQGADVIRIECPMHEADLVARSIHQTHVTLTTLEQVIGLLYGIIAVNRTHLPVALDGFAVIEPGASIIVDARTLSETSLAAI